MKYIRNVLLWLPAMIWYRIIWGFSAQTAAVSGNLSDRLLWRLMALLSPAFAGAEIQVQNAAVELLSFFERKAAHMFLYFVLILLLWLALLPWIRGKRRQIAVSFALCVILAALDEYHQTFIPGRSGQMRDVAVDLFGAALALLLAALLYLAARRQKIRCFHPACLIPMLLCVLLALLPAAAAPEQLAALPALSKAAARFVLDFAALSIPERMALLTALAPVLRETLLLAACGLLGAGAVLTAALSGLRFSSALGAALLFSVLWSRIIALPVSRALSPVAVALVVLGWAIGTALWLACLAAGRLFPTVK